MGTIRDQARAEAGMDKAPVVWASTVERASFRFEKGSVIQCANSGDASRLQGVIGQGAVERKGASLLILKPCAIRFFFDPAFGMCARGAL
jgi:hypothetical protein